VSNVIDQHVEDGQSKGEGKVVVNLGPTIGYSALARIVMTLFLV
jgi:hypothetical protein